MIIGADVGGTFTDVVAVDGDTVTTMKVPTTRPQSTGVAEAASSLGRDRDVLALIHGTTVATNALLERRGARTALVTDAGFEDVIEIARQDRPSLYDPFADRSDPLVRRDDRIGAGDGEAVSVPDGVESVAVALIGGHRDSAGERRIRDDLSRGRGDLPVSLSSEVAPEFREFERVSTTVLNAYLMPVTSSYLRALGASVVDEGVARSVAVMRSSGGLMSIEAAATLPAAVLLSGPAGGVVASRAVALRLGMAAAISFDMGGTSTDVCLIEEGEIDVSYERSIDGYACRLPSVGIHTVGAGGGSIAWVDEGGALRVGPHSAGAEPGPACYGLGGVDATVTDAQVVLGRIDPRAVFGGSVRISCDLADRAVRSLGERLGLTVEDTALGIVRIADAAMAGAVRTVSIDQGVDPAPAHLIAFGGAGGLHATAIARALGMAGVVVPPHAGVLSALGLLMSPPRADTAMAVLVRDANLEPVVAAAAVLTASSRAEIADAGHEPVATSLWVDVRYRGQAHEITVPWDAVVGHDGVVERFEAMHLRRNGFVRPGDPVEIVTVRAASFGPAPRVSTPMPGPGTSPNDEHTPERRRTVVSSGGRPMDARIRWRDELPPGTVVEGPAVIEEDDATTFIDRGERLEVALDGSLVVTWR
jgi:N-methylhydantoinase A